MAASTRLAKVVLGGIAVILVALAWKPWNHGANTDRDPASLATPGKPDAPIADPAASDPAALDQLADMTPSLRNEAVAAEHTRSASAKAQPPATFTGPDGKPHDIVYNQGLILSPGARAQLKRELLAQMQQHPDAVSRIYQISKDDIAAVVAGNKPFPEKLLDQ